MGIPDGEEGETSWGYESMSSTHLPKSFIDLVKHDFVDLGDKTLTCAISTRLRLDYTSDTCHLIAHEEKHQYLNATTVCYSYGD